MISSSCDPTPTRCPRCRSGDALEWPRGSEDVRDIFCRSCQGFKVRGADAAALEERGGSGLLGRLFTAATGERWLRPA